jgi:hypothetical protein
VRRREENRGEGGKGREKRMKKEEDREEGGRV